MAVLPVSLRTEPPRNNSFRSYSRPTEDSEKLLPTDTLCGSPPIRFCGVLACMTDSQIQMPWDNDLFALISTLGCSLLWLWEGPTCLSKPWASPCFLLMTDRPASVSFLFCYLSCPRPVIKGSYHVLHCKHQEPRICTEGLVGPGGFPGAASGA